MNTSMETLQLAAAIKADPRWPLVAARDARADGQFVYSVQTTGVYCRPSCAARLARPENVRFHPTCEDAERAGFRPCQRCRPNEASAAEANLRKIGGICRLLETADQPPDLEALAEHAGWSIWHLHRLFKAATGLTPREYAAAHRENRVRSGLKTSKSITTAIYDSGYNSNGRFYETSDRVLGMKPSHYRAGGPTENIRFAVGECSLGSILVAQSERGVCAILLGRGPELLLRDLQDSFPQANLIGGDAAFEQIVARVVGFVESPRLGLDLPLDIRGTAFQQRVWRALQRIPAGLTASYSDIAKLIGCPKSTRAVAAACAANTLAVAIPCHRVVRNDGALSGYRWGIERKRKLLEREARN